jgi:CheY-like chemotaxis protein
VTFAVLVVDDEQGVREVLQRWLERWGYQVRVAAHAREALESMLAAPADILLTDIKMPDRDGLWLVERVRAKWPNTPIIVASGVVEMEAVKKAQRLGAVDYVTKPFGRELLHQALQRAEQKRSQYRDNPERGNYE